MKKTKTQKGITLIALIITIIVLLILAVVSIRAIQGDGIIFQAKRARDEYSRTQSEEKSKLQEYEDLISVNIGEILKIQDIQGIEISQNTKVIDEYGNKFVVPEGFKITEDANHVNEGIVIEDVSAGNTGSQFVWVPVGKVYTDAEKTEENSKTIELKRYVFNDNGTINNELTKINPGEQLKKSQSATVYFTEGLKDSTTLNTHAKDIEGFISSVNTNGGYYIGRYEAGDGSATVSRIESSGTTGTLVCKENQHVYNYIIQPEAATKCRNMYENKPFTSDLVNSYAWDTTIVFIQKCSTEEDADRYSIDNHSTTFGQTGINNDKYCNINDMSGNARELTTESYSGTSNPCVSRGGIYGSGGVSGEARGRSQIYGTGRYSFISFRPILYL